VKEEEFSTRETGDDLVSSFLLLKNDPLHSCFKFQAPHSPRRTSLGNRAASAIIYQTFRVCRHRRKRLKGRERGREKEAAA